METFPQNKSTDRQPVAAGRFYPADKETLLNDLSKLFENCKKTSETLTVRAIIVPHAGYIFSGKIAASGYSTIPPDRKFKNIFIIGSSHVKAFDGASVYNQGDFITPLGRIQVNREVASSLIKSSKVFNYPTDAHIKEHSIEVQLPFIQYYFKDNPSIIPIIIGTDNENTVKKIAEALRPWFTTDNLFIISSDFSHYPAYNDAIKTDLLTALSIESGNPVTFLRTLNENSLKNIRGLATSMCGWTSGLALLYLAEGKSEFEIKLIDYCNSGDSPYSGKEEVVGYNALALLEKMTVEQTNMGSEDVISFTEQEKAQLFEIARNSIHSMLFENKRFEPDASILPAKFKIPMGVFVTLKIGGELRGCIGRFISSSPLYEVAGVSALSSAFEDPRFTPLSKEEYKKIEIEITVLGPLRKIHNINEIVLGKHGIYIKKDNREGTMLPQVAIENKWTVEQFLGYTSRDKAGIGWDGWKDAEIFIYEGIVLKDKNK